MPSDDMEALADLVLEIQRVESRLGVLREGICTLMRHYIADCNYLVAGVHILPTVVHLETLDESSR